MADDFLVNKPTTKDKNVFSLSEVQEQENEKSQIGDQNSKISNTTTIKYLPNGQKDFKSMNKD